MPLAQPSPEFIEQVGLPLSRTRRCGQLCSRLTPRISESDKTKRIVRKSRERLDQRELLVNRGFGQK
jgi:hypothetical protein